MRQSHLRPVFVEFIPETIEDGNLYVAMEYRTTAHRCCCGCGSTVYLPLGPTQWRLMFDGESIWIDPSIGSWSLPCQSHYWIRGNRIQWAEQWTRERVAAARAHDRYVRDSCFGGTTAASGANECESTPTTTPSSRWTRLKALLGLR